MITKPEFISKLGSGFYEQHPVDLVEEGTGLKMLPWQKDAITGLFVYKRSNKLAVSGPHGSGKSTFSAMLAFYFFLTKVPSKIIVTGPSGKTTKETFFHYFKSITKDCPLLDDIQMSSSRVYVKGNEYNWFITWLDCHPAKKIEGMMGPDEGKNLLWIVEDAKGIEAESLKTMEYSLMNDQNFIYANSVPPIGTEEGDKDYFRSLFIGDRRDWHTMQLCKT